MAIELTLEGKLENGFTQESFFDYLKELSGKKNLLYREYQDSVIMEVCPQGLIECSLENDFISILAQTNAAGPGFHAFVADLYEDILMNSNLSFQVYDSTDYYDKRDFESLKQNYFYRWLEEIIAYIKEHEQLQELCIAWPIQLYVPKSRQGWVVTPMGYIPFSSFSFDHLEELASQIFIWNKQERDAEFYRNCAWNLLWKDCYYEYTRMNEESTKAAQLIVDYMDVAYRLDPTIELPVAVYYQLCNLLECETLIPWRECASKEIGYRKEVVHYPFKDWLIPASGFCERFGIGGEKLLLNGPYRNHNEPWNWMLQAETKQEMERIENPDFRFISGDVSVTGVCEHEEGYEQIRVIAEHGEDALSLIFHYREPSTKTILLTYLHDLRHRPAYDRQDTDKH